LYRFDELCIKIFRTFPLEGKSCALSMMLPSFIYRIAEHRFGKIALYVIVFGAVFAFIVMYLVHLEGGNL